MNMLSLSQEDSENKAIKIIVASLRRRRSKTWKKLITNTFAHQWTLGSDVFSPLLLFFSMFLRFYVARFGGRFFLCVEEDPRTFGILPQSSKRIVKKCSINWNYIFHLTQWSYNGLYQQTIWLFICPYLSFIIFYSSVQEAEIIPYDSGTWLCIKIIIGTNKESEERIPEKTFNLSIYRASPQY